MIPKPGFHHVLSDEEAALADRADAMSRDGEVGTPTERNQMIGRLAAALAARAAVPAETPSEDEVLVEGSWFKRADLPEILGNFMRSSAEYAREAKDALATLTELRPVRDADTLALASRPTPPEDVAALRRRLVDLLDAHFSPVGRDEMVEAILALAAVPADGETEYRGKQILLRNGDQWDATAWNSLEEARTSWPEGEYRAV